MRAMVQALAATVPTPAAVAEEIRVRMDGVAYEPAVVEARLGDSIVFLNDDDTNHYVFIPTAGFAADLGRQVPLTAARLPLGQIGMFDVECVLHPQMHARVVVMP